MGTSPVSSTSTLVERGGDAGKCIMQLSMQVSVSELANTKDSSQWHNPESKNHQATDWKTSRPIPRHGHILYLFDPFLRLCFGENPCLHLCRAGKGENHLYEDHHCLLTSLSCHSFLWTTTKQSPLLTTIRDLVPVHRQRMLFQFFWIVLCLFLFPFLLFFSLNGP